MIIANQFRVPAGCTAHLRRAFSSTSRTLSHDNPLGLPRSGTPPSFRSRRGVPEKRKIRDVKKVVAVSSAKGGVGKSTVADNCLVPLTNYGLKSMSMGYLLPQTQADSETGEVPMDTTPISWRGLMVTKAMHQLLHSVSWGPLDVLVLDLPPGTGDVQLTINQEIIIDGSVIVTTPQDIALRDAVRGFGMFQRMDVPVLGMVRNMAYFACPNCGHQTRIFSHGEAHGSNCEDHGVVAECKRLGVDFLGDIPLDAQVCEDADRGMPTVVAEESTERSARRDAFLSVAEQVARKIGLEWK
ncbi:hypothetical protein N7478_007138 [Penicillium angulare]|uniref:uncharacterized protein n=1 Tax=Penicillium angulare TaxID=116970 RepID=UPI00254008E1|nr:uncharacterized protein N7478_007138 [Penicillium angulare]KAJ5281766.1 hypothetical protein N7478_007138 [Penicillium angulare]